MIALLVGVGMMLAVLAVLAGIVFLGMWLEQHENLLLVFLGLFILGLLACIGNTVLHPNADPPTWAWITAVVGFVPFLAGVVASS